MADEATTLAAPETIVDATPPVEVPPAEEPTILMSGAEQPAHEKPAEEQIAEADAKVDEPVVPEHYELTPPEGMEIDADALAQLEPVFKELKLSNEAANVLAGKLVEMKAGIVAAQDSAQKAVIAGWAEATKKDPGIAGANGTEYAKNIKDADLAFKKLTTPALQKAMLETGMVFHPEVVRMFLDFSKLMAEDTHIQGNALPQTETDRAHRMFDKSK